MTTPGNASHPLHLIPLIHNPPAHPRWPAYSTFGAVIPVGPIQRSYEASWLSHIVRNGNGGSGSYLVNNDGEEGEVWTVRLQGNGGQMVFNKIHSVPSNGAAPSYSHLTRDGKHLITVDVSKNVISGSRQNTSPTITLFRVTSTSLSVVQQLALPRSVHSSQSTIAHPHHIAQHPVIDDIIYITDADSNVLYTLKMSPELHVVKTTPVGMHGVGPRNSVVTPDGTDLFLSFQTSSNIAILPLSPDGMVLPDTDVYTTSTLPPELHEQYPTDSERAENLASSDILLHGETLFVANRRIVGPVPALPPTRAKRVYTQTGMRYFEHGTAAGGDTLAMFRVEVDAATNSTQLELQGHIQLGCYRPHELMVVKGDRDFLGVTCNGMDGVGGGVVLLDVLGGEIRVPRRSMETVRPPTWPVIGRWATEDGVWGIAEVI